MSSIISRLHEVVKEVELTEEEWMKKIIINAVFYILKLSWKV